MAPCVLFIALQKLNKKETAWPTARRQSLALHFATALLCPSAYGPIVYQARNLYALLSEMSILYDDDGCDSSSQSNTYRVTPNMEDVQDKTQAYSLFPNPNNGSFALRQTVPSDETVSVKVYNALGAQVYVSRSNFTNGRMELKMNQNTPGLYLVCIGDRKERTTCIRFIIK